VPSAPNNPPWTSETARQASLRRWELARANPQPQIRRLPEPSDSHAEKRLVRVRKQQDIVDSMILARPDPETFELLTRASDRLHTQEMELSGRPKPHWKQPKPGAHARKLIELRDLPDAPANVSSQATPVPSPDPPKP
jgi:hypothetical protein